ncbi:phosphoglycerate mutase 1 [Diaphorina citri]|uniref:phosphoglycerate mutase (2,3-diphosphoglycerate-dependent) n=1 Tax=Diaphorina citri TaxID=121845 RepID=A0A1S3DUM8_DIACI|nr:phosphoglycerate mutase 1 [Diaphorina citri]
MFGLLNRWLRYLRKMSEDCYTLVMLRHGESEWTKRNLFCGWYDSKLSENGIKEAHVAGQILRDEGFQFDHVFTSQLSRAQDTVQIILQELGQSPEVTKSWRLNERHYGDLTGYNKLQMANKYGLEQVQIWRRSYDVLPPPMTKDHKYYQDIITNPNFKIDGPNEDQFPHTESLKETIMRVLPYWNENIATEIKQGKKVLVVTHGTSLRGLVKHIEQLSDAEIMKLNIPTAIPFVYKLDANLTPTKPRQFLCDEETVSKAMEKVASISGYEEKQ